MGLFVLIASCVFACSIDAEESIVTKSWLAPSLYLATAIFQGLSLLLLSSNACKNNAIVNLAETTSTWADFPETCSLNTGGKLIISATAFWFAAAVASFGARKIERSAAVEDEEAIKAVDGQDAEAAEAEEVPEQAKV